jgi:hypothetical protein
LGNAGDIVEGNWTCVILHYVQICGMLHGG